MSTVAWAGLVGAGAMVQEGYYYDGVLVPHMVAGAGKRLIGYQSIKTSFLMIWVKIKTVTKI